VCGGKRLLSSSGNGKDRPIKVSKAFRLEAVSIGRSAGDRRAFTLIELLVTIAIIGIVASMILTPLAKGKKSSHSTYCRNNLRQLSLSLSMYASDGGFYPAYVSASGRGELTYWSRAIEPYVRQAWPATDLPGARAEDRTIRGVFACPSYDRVPGFYLNPRTATETPLGSYGYNRSGMGRPLGGPALGVGGELRRFQVPRGPADVIYARESAVARPADFFLMADSVFMPRNYGRGTRFAGADEINPFLLPWMAMELGMRSPGPIWEGARRATKARHEGAFNAVFGDCHVEILPVKKIFAPGNETLARWNTDNLPHRELLPAMR
jgi:prepilin-type N-terminal cleavage/methylation domain-containing protein/prepilin-type processing-associated H-X9-DG protein